VCIYFDLLLLYINVLQFDLYVYIPIYTIYIYVLQFDVCVYLSWFVGFLHECLMCPRSFHAQCLPPGYRVKCGCILCPSHPHVVVEAASIPPALSGAPNALASEEGRGRSVAATTSNTTNTTTADNTSGGSNHHLHPPKRSARSDSRNKPTSPGPNGLQVVSPVVGVVPSVAAGLFDSLLFPDECPEESDIAAAGHFRLDKRVKEVVENAPQNFKFINRIDYDTLPGKMAAARTSFQPEGKCSCKEMCGENCLNRILRIECYESKTRGRGDDNGGDDSNICCVGPNCGNRALQSKEHAEVEPFKEYAMGWGLRATAPVATGSLVIEYVGEAIDTATVHARIKEQNTTAPNDKDYYIMELDSGIYLDGKFKGSLSRFINHSCDPNCELQRWNVKGFMRIAIVAIRDIAAMEPLSYDYQVIDLAASHVVVFH
jgi:hypothetical protein